MSGAARRGLLSTGLVAVLLAAQSTRAADAKALPPDAELLEFLVDAADAESDEFLQFLADADLDRIVRRSATQPVRSTQPTGDEP